MEGGEGKGGVCENQDYQSLSAARVGCGRRRLPVELQRNHGEENARQELLAHH